MIWIIVLIIEIISEGIFTSLLPLTKGYFYHLLELYSQAIWGGILVLFINYFLLDLCQAIKAYFVLRASLQQRTWKTQEIIKNTLNKVSNIEQRIQEDIKYMYLNRLTVWAEYAISGFILIWLIIINYKHVFLVASALGYAILSVGIAYLFNPKMVYAEKIVQNTEATFRLNLSKSIDLLGFNETQRANEVAGKIRLNYMLFTKLQDGILLVLPYLFLVTPYLKHQINLGELMQIATTFGLLVVNADILIAVFPTLTQGRASAQRVMEMTNG